MIPWRTNIIYTYLYVLYMNIYLYMYVYIYTNIIFHVYIHMYMYIYNLYACICVLYICIYVYIIVYVCICKWIFNSNSIGMDFLVYSTWLNSSRICGIIHIGPLNSIFQISNQILSIKGLYHIWYHMAQRVKLIMAVLRKLNI